MSAKKEPTLAEILSAVRAMEQKMDETFDDIKKALVSIEGKLDTVDHFAAKRFGAAGDKIDAIECKIDDLTLQQGKFYEHAMRSSIALRFGERFARPFLVKGLYGLVRLVTSKTEDEDDIGNQLEHESKLLRYMFAKKQEHCAALRLRAPTNEAAMAFVASAEVAKDVGELGRLCIDKKVRSLALALFCAPFIHSRPIYEMEFDCRGDVITDTTSTIVRQVEFKRTDTIAATEQVLEHIAAEIAAILAIRGVQASGIGYVHTIGKKNASHLNGPVTVFDQHIEIQIEND